MNKFIGLLIVILISTGVTAQIYIGGEVSYAKGKTGENKEKLTSVLIAPEIGYKLKEKWAVGTSVRLESVEKGYSNETSYAIAPYVRYNIVKMGAITLFSDAALGLAMVEPDGGNGATEWYAGIRPGLSIGINNRFSFVTHVGFIGYKDSSEINGDKSFSLNWSDTNISVGFYWHF